MADAVNNLKSLTRQTKSVSCVINFPIYKGMCNLNAYNLNTFYDDLEKACFLFAFILHDKDIDDNGELKTAHLHLVIFSDKRHQLKYYVYLIADLLQCDENLISVRVSNSDAGDIQYLIHKNNENKFHYDINDIYTNINQDMFNDLMNRNIIQTFTVAELVKICSEHSRLEVMEIIGAERYTHYNKLINDIYKEIFISRRRA